MSLVRVLAGFIATPLDAALAGAVTADQGGHRVPAERQQPRIEPAPLGEPVYFPVGVKHRSTRR